MIWSGISISFKNLPQFVVIHKVKGFSVVNEAEVDVSLESSWFFYDPTDVSNMSQAVAGWHSPHPSAALMFSLGLLFCL